MADPSFQEQIVAFVRAFGLHQPDQTPCGQPMSVAEAHALTELARDAPSSQKDLAARLGLEKSTVSRLVCHLEDRGWIERRRSALDGRALNVVLTDSGRNIAAAVAAARAQKMERVLRAIPETQRPAVIAALGTLVEAIRDSSDQDR